MDSFELNKIIGAILGTLLFVMGVGFLAEAVYSPIEGRGPGYALPEPEVVAGGEAAPEVVAVPISVLLASSDPAAGQAAARKCASCHNFGEGEPNKTGPGLYGVVGRLEGSHEGFAYSDGMLAHNAAGDVWSYENLDKFLLAPRDYTPGTKMAFAGVKDDAERANIIAYLSTLSASPVPFPEPPAADATPAAEGGEAVPLAEGAVVETPTTTAGETPVEGTPAPETTETTETTTP
ncbi:MAG: c-type cytochrome [Devosia sp.]